MSAGAGAGAAAAIAARKKLEAERKEEEEMTKYDGSDLEGWEFKIVRSATGKFSKYEEVQKVISEESQAGWELLEKFDDSRIRFKRKIEKRSKDQYLEIDPYRTNYGMNQNKLAAVVILSIVGVTGLIALLAILLSNS